MKSLGDIAEETALKLAAESAAPLGGETNAWSADNKLIEKIRFSWKPEDRAMIERIRVSCDAAMQEALADYFATVDLFYEQLRVPEQREVGGHMTVMREADGRPVWCRDHNGNIIEDWSQLTGQDIEMTLAQLIKIRLVLAPQVNQLFLEALYARHGASDVYDDTWFTMMDGTQGDRQARSNRESREDRYHAYFRFYLHSVAETFLKEITRFEKLLENIRYWQVRTQKG